MRDVLQRWNMLDAAAATREVLPCCGSQAWAAGLAGLRPVSDAETLLAGSDTVWFELPVEAWQEAFDSHPRIGRMHAEKAATAESLAWSAREQKSAVSNDEAVKQALAASNARYEAKFGRIFIVCASGRSAAEILANLEGRMGNDAAVELREAAEQQRQITHLRLRRWLNSE